MILCYLFVIYIITMILCYLGIIFCMRICFSFYLLSLIKPKVDSKFENVGRFCFEFADLYVEPNGKPVL